MIVLDCSDEETQKHLLQWKPILDKIGENFEAVTVVYDDIFDRKKQLNAVKFYSKLFEIREDMLSSQN